MAFRTACATAVTNKAKAFLYKILAEAGQFSPGKCLGVLQVLECLRGQEGWAGLNQFHSLLTTMAKSWLTVPVCDDGSLWKLYEALGIAEGLKPLQTQLMQIKYNASQGKRIYPKKLKQDNRTTVLHIHKWRTEVLFFLGFPTRDTLPGGTGPQRMYIRYRPPTTGSPPRRDWPPRTEMA